MENCCSVGQNEKLEVGGTDVQLQQQGFNNIWSRSLQGLSITCTPVVERNFVCNLCPQAYFTQQGVDLHLKVVHLKEKSYKCDKCSYDTTSTTSLKIHFVRVHDEGFAVSKFVCKSCGYRALSKPGLAFHVNRMHHPEEKKRKHLDHDSTAHSFSAKSPVVLLNRIQLQVV